MYRHNVPICIRCRQRVPPHRVENCLRFVALEQDWRLWKYGERSHSDIPSVVNELMDAPRLDIDTIISQLKSGSHSDATPRS